MTESKIVREDHRVIAGLIEPGSRVLDLGCGQGDLLALIVREKGARAQGIELREEAIYACVEKGLSVFHGDIESGLGEFPDDSFDDVILNQSMQEVRNVEFILREALRVGRRAIVGFPNFAHWKSRWDMAFHGVSPTTPSLPYRWHDTPNVHFFSVRDFLDFCREKGLRVLSSYYFAGNGRIVWAPNLRAESAVFTVSRGEAYRL